MWFKPGGEDGDVVFLGEVVSKAREGGVEFGGEYGVVVVCEVAFNFGFNFV